MAYYNIPPQFKPGFYQLARIDNKTAHSIASELSKLEVGLGPRSISSDIKLKFKNVNIADVIKTIFSITSLIQSKELTLEDTIKSLVNSYKEDEEPKLSKDFEKKLEKNLLILLENNHKLTLTIKAFKLAGEYQKIYSESRVISDIRIIFDENLNSPTQNSLIVHQLRIDYTEDDKLKRTLIALDIDDLNELKEQINRAIEKDKNMRRNFAGNITFIQPKD